MKPQAIVLLEGAYAWVDPSTNPAAPHRMIFLLVFGTSPSSKGIKYIDKHVKYL